MYCFMKKLKTGILLILLGNLLYLAYIYFYGNETNDFSNFSNFSSGFLLGLSIGCNLVGITLAVAYMSKKQ